MEDVQKHEEPKHNLKNTWQDVLRKKENFNDWPMTIDESIYIDCQCEGMNGPLDDPNRKRMFVRKPIGVG